MSSGLSLADHITLELRADIIGGRLLPGRALVEGDLVIAYNASRNTIREALHRLGQEGLTLYVRNKGVMVRQLGADQLRDLFQVRRTLELQAISASRPLREYQSDHMLDAIETAQLAREREDWRAVGTHSLRFHQHIVGLLRSPLFDEFFTNVVAQLRLVFSAAPDESRFQAPWLERDRHIHDLLVEGDKPGAYDALSDYLDDSEQQLLELFNHPSRH
ncbi:pyruvate dehydrogenase complex transcriptional repressor PdhR [Pseudomonas sp. FW306-02-F02-AA]|uniref:GntR family transcriptional regulator n=1 Tax=Pseudomonas fluorescens TaxID=294 RepID=A0A0N9WEY1_PSEFL|nr:MULTISPECIES: GntR family transcriptional regulator [Pseudomonas]ALI03048.1 GntR family transcriptional regulator [Pseudomonas fluorescens]PMZ04096.1 pyruvate dehydrogenase complex transcriptional repressor PdhR [Pseudomonas sp. FW306-02-F02-AB]PMZ10251.1 pyruvate dehydrogenase complex transcriptional repressor PdhR [Pseudomonas sp. FW306-02-H06C]PMZ15678.1 pyruvate dehydrogenase complex transcriptional repressor PdhR [Pseudomonas sp. FW306-02-F02-AA]PMZ20855.1 pyruvate dehydrogenase comple